MIAGMNDEGWEGGDWFSKDMRSEMKEITDFRAQGSPISERMNDGKGDGR